MGTDWTYQEALGFIEGLNRFGKKDGQEHIRRLLEELGNPQKDFKVIHVAGTNGKGSICSFLANILEKGGYGTGLFTSPHIEDFRERIAINGQSISKEELTLLTAEIKSVVLKLVERGSPWPTEFDVITALGFLYFSRKKIDIAVIETGLGGRLDSTNVCQPMATVISSISMDHMAYLGDTLEQIALEKAGIIKPGVPVILYAQSKTVEKIILDQASQKKSPVFRTEPMALLKKDLLSQTYGGTCLGEEFPEVKIFLPGRHQGKNMEAALLTIQVLRRDFDIALSKEAILEGLQKTAWLGRLEVLRENPPLILDGAHNQDGAAALAAFLKEDLAEYDITLIIGMLQDKDRRPVLDTLLPCADKVLATQPLYERRLAADILADEIRGRGISCDVLSSLKDVVQYALKESQSAILITGSLYLLGDIRPLLRKELGTEKQHSHE